MKLDELGKIKNILEANLPLKIENQGKMLRSKIGLLFLKMFDIVIEEKYLKFLAIIELIHNASLFHDDVIDDETFRRGQDSLNKVYGEKKSILFGNLTLSNTLSLLLEFDNLDLIADMNNCVKKMCYGELLQQDKLNKIPTINEYIKKTRLKTASLFKYMMSGLVVLSGLKFKDEFESFGDNFGVGFQISNDLKDYISGVENSSDVKNGVFTAPIIYAKSVKMDFSAIAKTKDLMDNYLKRAINIVDNLGINSNKKVKSELIGVIECLKI